MVHRPFTDLKKAHDSVKREVPHNILPEFGIYKKLVRLIKMCLNEAHSKVRAGKPLSDISPIQNGPKQGKAPSLLFFNFAPEHIIRKIPENQVGLELNGTHQPLVHADDANLFDDSTNTIKENTETLLEASRNAGPEINAKKTKYMTTSRHPNPEQNQNTRTANESF
jgi:hypothetical protein